jgi:predicted transposase YdaD
MVYKFPNLTREEIMQVLELATEVKQTRFYQDVLEEGKQVGLQEGRAEEGRSFVLRLLNRRVGTIAPELKTKIEALTIAQLEDLGEALLDFASVTDLEAWLDQV